MAGINFERLLKTSIGLDAASIGVSAIDRAVVARQAACHLQSRDAYWELVRTSEAELQALVEAVVVPETWFFRDPEAFAAAAEFVKDSCLSRPDYAARALSLPCSTGEEPYSLAMTLLDAGVPAERFRVDAIDVSQRALAAARQGVYRKTSFRKQGLEYRDRHFENTAAGHRIGDRVRAQVDFRHGNLLHADSLPASGIYDIVFCRNVLIYFDQDAQARAIGTLSRLLAPHGLLFVGPAESAVLLAYDFVPARIPKAHAFRRAHDTTTRRLAQVRLKPDTTEGRSKLATTKPSALVPFVPPQPRPAEPTEPRGDLTLASVAELADEGRFAEAAERCETYLRRHGQSAQAYYLLGLVRDASGRSSDAVASYRKALYLEPDHHDALLHLALLMETQHNRAEANRLRARARRASRQERES